MTTMIYDEALNQQLYNPLHYYQALAKGSQVDVVWGRIVFKTSIAQRAEAIAEEQRKYTAAPLNKHGNKVGISDAVFQFRADVAALKLRKDKEPGEVAAIGRAAVLQETFYDLLKAVKKLSPTQKARKEQGLESKAFDELFNNITLHFSHNRLSVDTHIINESGEATAVSVSFRIGAKIETAEFAVSLEWRTLLEVVKSYDKERLDLEYRDWINRFAIRQRRNTTRLIVQAH